MKYKVLVVDDIADDLEVTRQILAADSDFEVVTEMNPLRAIALVKENPNQFAGIALDYRMPMNGLDVAQAMYAINRHLQIMILSSDRDREVLKRSIRIGVRNFVDKDDDSEILLGVVHSLCTNWQNRVEVLSANRVSPDQYEKIISSINIVGASSKMAEVAQHVKRAAKADCRVLIHGESGTGKELIAKAIHQLSSRRSKPFIGINVGALPDNLIESELFGHVKGSFTSADKDSPGKILAANGGTLFLDEIGELKPELQVKLLRVLQEGSLSPVGSSKVLPFDVRIISATHVDLEKAMLENRFREDLFYRLHVFPIEVPPLRERPEDIPLLIEHFLKLKGGTGIEFLMKSVRLMERYEWRGNIRELENEIERLIALGYSSIEPQHLSPKILRAVNYENDEIVSHHQFQRQLWEIELEYLEKNIRLAGSLREACRSIFKSAPSSIHTRIAVLKEHISKSNLREVNYESNV